MPHITIFIALKALLPCITRYKNCSCYANIVGKNIIERKKKDFYCRICDDK